MKKVLSVLSVPFLCVAAFADDTIVLKDVGGPFPYLEYAWTSDASGAATGTADSALSGMIYKVITVPGSGGTQPTSYSATVKETVSVAGTSTTLSTDISNGLIASRSTTATETIQFWPTYSYAFSGKLTIGISGAGASKTGTIKLYISRQLLAAKSRSGPIDLEAGGATVPTSNPAGAITLAEANTLLDYYYSTFANSAPNANLQWHTSLPADYDSTVGTVTFTVEFVPTSGSGNITWSLSAVDMGDQYNLAAASFGTAATVTMAINATGKTHVTGVSAPLTIGGTPTAGHRVHWKLCRTDGSTAGINFVNCKVEYPRKLNNS